MHRRGVLVSFLGAVTGPAPGRRIDPPAQPGSGMPFFASGPGGSVYLSWIDPVEPGGQHALRFARWTSAGWSPPETIAQGAGWFVNWADFGSLAVQADGTMLAHWLTRAPGGGKFGYGIRIARRDARTRRWREIHGLSLDEPVDYAGFLAFVPGRREAIYLSPPKPADAEGHRKTVRVIAFEADGRVASDREVDPDACSCCQTAIGRTQSGWVAVYRDHQPGEIRDISVVRSVNGAWSAPQPVHRDGWKINGCPTEGPSLVAGGARVAVAWLTRAGGGARVQLAFSADEGRTFREPVRVDGGQPLGRPALAAHGRDGYLVTWLEKTAAGGLEVRLRRAGFDGTLSAPLTIGAAPPGRTSGFPKLAVFGEEILLAWRDDRVHAVRLNDPWREKREKA